MFLLNGECRGVYLANNDIVRRSNARRSVSSSAAESRRRNVVHVHDHATLGPAAGAEGLHADGTEPQAVGLDSGRLVRLVGPMDDDLRLETVLESLAQENLLVLAGQEACGNSQRHECHELRTQCLRHSMFSFSLRVDRVASAQCPTTCLAD